MGVPETIGWDVYKFNEECTKFNEGCTKGPKMSHEVGIYPQSHCYEFLKAIMDYPC